MATGRGPRREWDRHPCVYGFECLRCDSTPPPPLGHPTAEATGELCVCSASQGPRLTTDSLPLATEPMFRQQGKGQ